VKIVGGMLPDGIRLIVNLRRIGGTTNYPNDSALVDERGRFFVPGLMPGEYELRMSHSAPGPLPRESLAQILPAISKIKQTVSATNGAAAEVAITIDLGQEKN
jgi:hypothetical protein